MLTATIDLIVNVTHEDVLDLATAKDNFQYSKRIALGSGLLANQVDTIFHDKRTVAIGADDDVDLNGTLVDAFGNSVDMVKVVALIIALEAGAGPLAIGGEGVADFVNWVAAAGDIVNVGDLFTLVRKDLTGYGVTAGTADLLRVSNSGADEAQYTLIALGRSA